MPLAAAEGQRLKIPQELTTNSHSPRDTVTPEPWFETSEIATLSRGSWRRSRQPIARIVARYQCGNQTERLRFPPFHADVRP